MKKIRTYLLFTAVCIASFNAQTFGQKTMQGIYLSANDFKNNKISYTAEQGKKYHLRLNETFYKPTITVNTGDSSYILNKETLFGYRDKDNTIHRFYEKQIYILLNPNENILLYSRTISGVHKNAQNIVTYYFSKDANATIMPLTKKNLNEAFPTDTVFHEFLDMTFRNDHDLLDYDHFYKMYKLNRVLQFSEQLSLKNN